MVSPRHARGKSVRLELGMRFVALSSITSNWRAVIAGRRGNQGPSGVALLPTSRTRRRDDASRPPALSDRAALRHRRTLKFDRNWPGPWPGFPANSAPLEFLPLNSRRAMSQPMVALGVRPRHRRLAAVIALLFALPGCAYSGAKDDWSQVWTETKNALHPTQNGVSAKAADVDRRLSSD